MKKLIFLWLSCLFISKPLSAQIAITGSNTSTTYNSNSITFANTIPSGNNMILIIGVTTKETGISSVTFSGTAMTQLTLVSQASLRVALYYRLLGNLSNSLTANVVVNIITNDNINVGAMHCSGVNQGSPFGDVKVAKAQSSNATVTYTSGNGNLGIAMLGALNTNAYSLGSGQTLRWSINGNHSNRLSTEPGTSTVTSSYSLSATDWALIGTSLQASNVSLDVDLKDFDVSCFNNYFQLDWETLTEKNTDYFKAQRSLNMLDWTDVCRIKAAGNAQVLRKYSYQDAFDALSLVYYRLIEVDLDKSEKILMVKNTQCAPNPEDDILVYPNPSHASVLISRPSNIL